MIVMKFGGSSLESSAAVQRVTSIVRDHLEQRPVVVVSAMGKTTDKLLSIGRLQAEGKTANAGRELAALQQFHNKEAAALVGLRQSEGVTIAIGSHFDELREDLIRVHKAGALTAELSDSILSFGERLSSIIVTAAFRRAGLDAVHLDSRSAILTDNAFGHAAPQFLETNALVRRRVSRQHVTVMGGFIGATEDRRTTTLGRGGSDYTAAIVGAAIGADEIQIWTDVDGMMTCDPRIHAQAHCLRSISYSDAWTMAEAGAKVLHPATVVPAVKQRIPISIRNSRNPQAPGTVICEDSPADGAVLSIACRRDVDVLRLAPRNTPASPEFAQLVWDIFRQRGVVPQPATTSPSEICLLVEKSAVDGQLVAELERVGRVVMEQDRALITLVGPNVAQSGSITLRAAARLRNAQIAAETTRGSASSIAFLVPLPEISSAVEAFHAEFFSHPDPRLFIADRTATAGDAQARKVRAGASIQFSHA